MPKFLFATLVPLALCIATLKAQTVDFERVYGDAGLKAPIAAQTRLIYDMDGAWIFQLTQTSPRTFEGAVATELQGKVVANQVRRIVTTEWWPTGKYSTEYYFSETNLLYVYEAFEYFEETSPDVSWRNFKGLAAWERRSYFKDGEIGYAEVVAAGEVEPGSDATNLLEAAHRFRMALLKHIPE